MPLDAIICDESRRLKVLLLCGDVLSRRDASAGQQERVVYQTATTKDVSTLDSASILQHLTSAHH